MLRIRTKIGEGHVFTLFFMGKWITLVSDGKKTSSTDANTLSGAGINHLAYCQKLKEITDERRRLAEKLLHGAGHQGPDPRSVSGGNARPDREGPDGDDREGRNEVLPTDSLGPEDEGPSQL